MQTGSPSQLFSSAGAPAHGGALKPLLAEPGERDEWIQTAPGLASLTLNPRQVADIECLGVGAFSPLEGFLGRADYESVLSSMRLVSGLPWSIPVTISATAMELEEIKGAEHVVLRHPSGAALAILHLEEVFDYEKEEEAKQVFRTTDPAHPGVEALYAQGERLLGGRVTVLELPPERGFLEHRLTPQQTREVIEQRGWRRVVGFQTRNPIHRAHEYLTKSALEIVDGLLCHPLVGETKEGDIPAEVRMQAYEALLDGYYPRDRVLLSVFPAAMRYAGPREAIFHAICRKNYGCTHFIVGRDHAGVGNYYGTFDAHEIFGEFTRDEIGIIPLFFDHSFWCRRCGQMATTKTCPHPEEDRVALSGTEVRRRLVEGEEIPQEFSRPEVADILREAAAREAEQ